MSHTRTSALIFFIGLFPLFAKAAILPKEGARMNYINIYFEEELQPGGNSYQLVLYSDSSMENDPGFLQKAESKIPAFHISGLDWGTSYYWRVEVYNKAHKLILSGKPHSFRILDIVISFPNAVESHLDIKTNKKEKHAGGLLMIDYTRCIYDRDGHALWTLPDIRDIIGKETQVRDLKLTRDNTVTFLTEKDAVEIDLDANVLWKAPQPFIFEKDTIVYHHDLKKTARGTYMVLGTRKVNRPLLGTYTAKQMEQQWEVTTIDKKLYKKTQATVLLEFDHNGNLLWFWDADTYISNEDLEYKKYMNGLPVFMSHSNAFSESEDGKTVYVGFRDLSRIVKISKASKKVKMSYGEKFPSGDAKGANNLFRKQHDGTLTKRKTLLIFNNNEAAAAGKAQNVSGIIEIKENAGPRDTALWSFPLNFDNLTTAFSPGGGNVTELPNTNILLCAGSLNRIFEVTRDKEVVWDALLLMRFRNENNWRPFPQYRCSWIPYIKGYHFLPVVTFSSQEINLSLTNTGNAEDSYMIEVKDGEKVIYSAKTNVLQANQVSELAIPLKSFSGDIKNVSVRIISGTDKSVKEIRSAF